MPLSQKLFLLGLSFLLASCTASVLQEAVPENEEEHTKEKTEIQAVATLRPKEEQMGNGFSELQCFSDRCIHTMRVNLVPIKRGLYQAWLLPEVGGPVKSGVLAEGKNEGTYFLKFESATIEKEQIAKPKKLEAMVSWEPPNDEFPDAPYEEVVQGSFTVVEEAKR